MAAPCIQDTCSITTAIDAVTRQLSIDARLNPTGGLKCTDGLGLGLAIYEDPGTSGALIDACLNGLRRTGGGEVLSVSPRAGLATVGGVTRGIPLTGAESTTSFTMNTTNPHECTTLGVAIGRMEFIYSPLDPLPFNADIRGRILRDGSPVAAVYADIGGDMSGPPGLANSVKRRYAYFVELFTSFGGATTTWTATANHEDSNEIVNIQTTGTESGADLGFRSILNVIHLPFNFEAA